MSDCLCALLCMCCKGVMKPAAPGHEQDPPSHGLGRCCWDGYRAEQGLAPAPYPTEGATRWTGEHCRVNPDTIIEAPEPQPVERPTRQRDLVLATANRHGYNALVFGLPDPPSYGTWLGALQAREDYLAVHERRGR